MKLWVKDLGEKELLLLMGVILLLFVDVDADVEHVFAKAEEIPLTIHDDEADDDYD